MFNLLHMMGSHNHDIPIVAGSYYALIDELEAQASGMPAALTYRLPVPMGASGVLFSDTLHGMAPFVPQSPVFYDIRSTPDDDAASIPAFFALVDAMADDAEVMIVSTGTLTPLAKMFTKEYEQEMRKVVLPKLSKVVLMAGALEVPGNLFTKEVNKKAEFNIYNVCSRPLFVALAHMPSNKVMLVSFVAVIDSCRCVPACCVICGVHSPAPVLVSVGEPSHSCYVLHPIMVAQPAVGLTCSMPRQMA